MLKNDWNVKLFLLKKASSIKNDETTVFSKKKLMYFFLQSDTIFSILWAIEPVQHWKQVIKDVKPDE